MLYLSLCRNIMLACKSTTMCSVYTLIQSSWCRFDVNLIMGSGVSGPKPPTSKCLTVSLYFSLVVKTNLVIINVFGGISKIIVFYNICNNILKWLKIKKNSTIYNICFYIYINVFIFNIVKPFIITELT